MSHLTTKPLYRVAIVGGGVSGLAFLHGLVQALEPSLRPHVDILLLEADSRLGGRVHTIRENGYVFECGADGVLARKPTTLQFAFDLSLASELVTTLPAARRRYIYYRGRLQEVPLGPFSLAISSLLSVEGKLRLLVEPFIPKGRGVDVSVEEFARRRFGSETTRVLIDCLCLGIFGVPSRYLSAQAAFPALWRWEREAGSVMRGAFLQQLRRLRERNARALLGPQENLPRRGLWSFRKGMGQLMEAAAQRYSSFVRTGWKVNSLEALPGAGWKLFMEEPRNSYEADVVVLACDASSQGQILRKVAPNAARILSQLRYVGLVVVGLGFQRAELERPLNGFGYLVVPKESRGLLGVLWSSSVFPDRAPQGHVLLRVMVGGVEHPEWLDMPEPQVLAGVQDELRRTMGLVAKPTYVRFVRWKKAIPIPEPGHLERIAAVRQALGPLKGLISIGNFYEGVSVNDCVGLAVAKARQLAAELDRTGESSLRRRCAQE
jgi:oxygen-dependent protoporphyrinogen oxidase